MLVGFINFWPYRLRKLIFGQSKHCEILVSCSDKEMNCMQAHVTACKLRNFMQAHVTACKLM